MRKKPPPRAQRPVSVRERLMAVGQEGIKGLTFDHYQFPGTDFHVGVMKNKDGVVFGSAMYLNYDPTTISQETVLKELETGARQESLGIIIDAEYIKLRSEQATTP